MASTNSRMSKLDLANLDRRIIFLCIAVAVIIPMILKKTMPFPTSPVVQSIFDKMESMPAGSPVLLSFDYGPSTEPENQPMAEAITRHCMIKNFRLIMMAVWATGPPQIDKTINNVIKVDFPDKVYGENYINIGFKAGNQGLINAILRDLKSIYTTDVQGKDVNTFPILKDITNLRNISLIIGIGSGYPGVKEWIQFGSDPAQVPMAGGMTAVEAPLLYPYYPKQLLGLMGGLLGAAEYEAALVKKYPQYKTTKEKPQNTEQAIKSMVPQTVAHIVIIIFIILGNIFYFLEKRNL
ncbi:MAG: hypothetical protein A2161_00475 [Candidatus Schekmanbacteria bacterium RBG_13_48_7]|uniref:Uncharacterized protein n=1 Tax=Candidatus Schekmanbacteria bacterium RBG_13_48_7 TaxID=1817878 RepID=A0A1F7RK68_9BACT|nr:MAG: hypothetical protein A2161_00475 [Candidatus Schekmanbacteria bacterium RBG_13_48_7]